MSSTATEPHQSSPWSLVILCTLFAMVLAVPFMLRPDKPAATATGSHITGAARKIIIISPHWEGIRREFGRAFSRWAERELGQNVTLEWLDVGGTSEVLKYIRSEFKRSPDGIAIDIFFGGGIDPYIQLKGERLLQPASIPSEVLVPIPEFYHGIPIYDTDRHWFGACLGGFGIVYNRRVLELLHLPEPTSWDTLADPAMFTWVGSGDPRSSGSIHMVYEIILQAYGWDKGWEVILGMGGNVRSFPRGGGDVPKDTAVGEVACGVAIDVYAWRQMAEAGADKLGFIFPPGMTVINPDGIGILKGAPNAELAAQFIRFVLSEEGQRLWTLKKGTPGGPQEFTLSRMPVIPGLVNRIGEDASVRFDPFEWKAGFVYDPSKGSKRYTILNDLIGAFVIDTHPQAMTAWRSLRLLPVADPRRREFLRMPVSEQECLKLADTVWNDSVERARIRSEWTVTAKRRYDKIAGEQK